MGGAFVLFLAATNIQSGWLFVLSSLLLGTAIGGALLPTMMVRKLDVERSGPAEAFVGDDVPVDLTVSNRSRGIRLSLMVRDPLLEPTTIFIPSLIAGEHVTARTLRKAKRRGVFEHGRLHIASTAPFGVAEARRSLTSSGRTVIFPRVVPIARAMLPEAGVDRSGHMASNARREDGREFLGVREYRHGDSLRHVHWPSTARRGSLVVREMEREHSGSVTILVDTWADGGTDETVLDLCCTVAASAALAVLSEGRDVLLGAARAGEALPPARMGRTEALTWLAELTAPGGQPFSAVVEAASGAASARASTCLLVLPTWKPNDGAALRRPLTPLIASGARLLAVLIEPSVSGKGLLDPAEKAELRQTLASVGAEVRTVASLEDVAGSLGGVSAWAG